MTHNVFILDDEEDMARSIQESIKSVDRDVTFVVATTVGDAMKQLEGHLPEFLYGVVDLHLDDNPRQDLHGEAFLKWLDDGGWLQRISVLVFSSYPNRSKNLPRDINQHVSTGEKTASYKDNDQTIRRFVEKILRQPAGAGAQR